MRAVVLALAALGLSAAVGACQRKREPAPEEGSLGTIRLGAKVKVDPRFDEAWRALSARTDEEADVFYIEDDRGEGLMGRVRRAARTVPRPPAPASPTTTTASTTGDPDVPSGEAVSAAVRANLPTIKACYLRLTREGRLISGRAILSFTVEKDGSARNVRVEAPAFEESPLPRCMAQQVERWSFPRSKRGGFAVSYPFVFVGG
jgi:hypothetical protein